MFCRKLITNLLLIGINYLKHNFINKLVEQVSLCFLFNNEKELVYFLVHFDSSLPLPCNFPSCTMIFVIFMRPRKFPHQSRYYCFLVVEVVEI